MKYDLVGLLANVMKQAGINDIKNRSVDNHSIICLNMKNELPAVYLHEEEEHVWIWSSLGEYHVQRLAFNSEHIIEVLMQNKEAFFYFGQPAMHVVYGMLELRAQITEIALQSPFTFNDMLDRFLLSVQTFSAVIK